MHGESTTGKTEGKERAGSRFHATDNALNENLEKKYEKYLKVPKTGELRHCSRKEKSRIKLWLSVNAKGD